MTDNKRMDPSTRFVRSLDGEYFMLREAAAMLGISSQALRKTVHDTSLNAPSFWVMFGKLKIYLYTRADVEETRKWFKEREQVFRTGEGPQPKVGRPRKYTQAQRAEKQREYARSYYWRKQLERGQKEENQELITKAKAKLFELAEDIAAARPEAKTVVINANVKPETIDQKSHIYDEDLKIHTDHRESRTSDRGSRDGVPQPVGQR